jgi:hypothetical protein
MDKPCKTPKTSTSIVIYVHEAKTTEPDEASS